MDSDTLKIIQISDTHLFAQDGQSLLGVPTQESLDAVIESIKREAGAFDMVIHSGDLTQDYARLSYIRVAEMVSQLNAPIYCVPGNHDDPKLMADVYPHERMMNDKHILHKTWQIILLDSHKHHAVYGYLADKELAHLEHCLSSYPNHHALIVFHHQPMPVGSRWLDELGLQNADDFWKLVTRFKNVKTVLFGHVHQVFEQEVHGVKCYSAPSTCFQFKRHQDEFGIEKLSPGFRWIHLHEDGRIETGVIRVDHYVGEFEGQSKGY